MGSVDGGLFTPVGGGGRICWVVVSWGRVVVVIVLGMVVSGVVGVVMFGFEVVSVSCPVFAVFVSGVVSSSWVLFFEVGDCVVFCGSAIGAAVGAAVSECGSVVWLLVLVVMQFSVFWLVVLVRFVKLTVGRQYALSISRSK